MYLTIDKCVENVLSILLHQVINVSEDSTEQMVSQIVKSFSSSSSKDSRHFQCIYTYHIVAIKGDVFYWDLDIGGMCKKGYRKQERL